MYWTCNHHIPQKSVFSSLTISSDAHHKWEQYLSNPGPIKFPSTSTHQQKTVPFFSSHSISVSSKHSLYFFCITFRSFDASFNEIHVSQLRNIPPACIRISQFLATSPYPNFSFASLGYLMQKCLKTQHRAFLKQVHQIDDKASTWCGFFTSTYSSPQNVHRNCYSITYRKRTILARSCLS